MVGLQLRWLRQRFLRVHFSHMKWYAKHGCTISITVCSLVQTQQFVLLIQQVQAPEDLAAALPIPSPQAAAPTQPPSPSENAPIASTNAVPATAQDTNATPPLQQGVSFLSIVRFILQLAWYDDHNRICTLPSSPCLPPDERASHRVPHTHRACPRRAHRGRAGARSPPPRGPLFVHLGAADRARGASWAPVHPWAQVRHRNDRGAHATRYV